MDVAKLSSESYYTVEQYLERERQADRRSEYIDGKIRAMADESGVHADVSMNLAGTLGFQLRGTNCRARTKLSRVRSGALKEHLGMISYPDMVVICGEVEYHDNQKDVILNPRVVLEVLSDLTEQFDRGTKFMRYPTLTDYILIAQTEPHVEHHLRLENGEWLLREYDGLDKIFRIESINCIISLTELYDRVDFE